MRLSLIAAGLIAGLFGPGLTPASAQDKKPLPTDARALELEIGRLKIMQELLQARLKQLTTDQEARRLKDKPDRLDRERAFQEEIQKAMKLQQDRVRQAQAKFEKALRLKMGPGITGEKGHPDYERMSPRELKELIGKLERILDEKMRNPDRERGREGDRGEKGRFDERRRGEERKPGMVPQEEILRRLDQLSREVEELRRAIKK